MLTDKEINALFRKLVVVDDDGLIYGLQEACRAVIEANNAKILADLKPAEFALIEGHGNDEYWRLSETYEPHTAAYSPNTVSALIQRNEALEAMFHNLRNGVMFDRIDWEDYPEISRDAFKDLMKLKDTP